MEGLEERYQEGIGERGRFALYDHGRFQDWLCPSGTRAHPPNGTHVVG